VGGSRATTQGQIPGSPPPAGETAMCPVAATGAEMLIIVAALAGCSGAPGTDENEDLGPTIDGADFWPNYECGHLQFSTGPEDEQFAYEVISVDGVWRVNEITWPDETKPWLWEDETLAHWEHGVVDGGVTVDDAYTEEVDPVTILTAGMAVGDSTAGGLVTLEAIETCTTDVHPRFDGECLRVSISEGLAVPAGTWWLGRDYGPTNFKLNTAEPTYGVSYVGEWFLCAE